MLDALLTDEQKDEQKKLQAIQDSGKDSPQQDMSTAEATDIQTMSPPVSPL